MLAQIKAMDAARQRNLILINLPQTVIAVRGAAISPPAILGALEREINTLDVGVEPSPDKTGRQQQRNE